MSSPSFDKFGAHIMLTMKGTVSWLVTPCCLETSQKKLATCWFLVLFTCQPWGWFWCVTLKRTWMSRSYSSRNIFWPSLKTLKNMYLIKLQLCEFVSDLNGLIFFNKEKFDEWEVWKLEWEMKEYWSICSAIRSLEG